MVEPGAPSNDDDTSNKEVDHLLDMRSDDVLDKLLEHKIGKHYSTKRDSTAIDPDGNLKSSGLKVGNLQIGDDVNNLHDFGKR